MLKFINIQDEISAEQILKLQRASYKVEAELLNYYLIPPLTENIVNLMASKETFIGFEK